MVIGGLQKNSLIDYPGKISCVLFLSGCNFECPYCHNPELVKGGGESSTSINKNRVHDFLKKRKKFLNGVVISGGEPTIHQDLIFLCEKIKQMGYPVKLDTNGSRPRVIQRLIDQGLVDYIAMDVKTDPHGYASFIQKECDADQILSSIQIIMDSNIAHEFKTTCIKPIVDAGVIETISRQIQGAMLYVVQRFHHTKVLRPEFFENVASIYDDDELNHLKSIAEKWVGKCIVR